MEQLQEGFFTFDTTAMLAVREFAVLLMHESNNVAVLTHKNESRNSVAFPLYP